MRAQVEGPPGYTACAPSPEPAALPQLVPTRPGQLSPCRGRGSQCVSWLCTGSTGQIGDGHLPYSPALVSINTAQEQPHPLAQQGACIAVQQGPESAPHGPHPQG